MQCMKIEVHVTSIGLLDVKATYWDLGLTQQEEK